MQVVNIIFGLLLCFHLPESQSKIQSSRILRGLCDVDAGSCDGLRDGTLTDFKDDCSKFILCSKGCGIEMQCPYGLHFSNSSKNCDWPTSAKCDPLLLEEKPTPKPIFPLSYLCKEMENGVTFANKFNSSNFNVCINGYEKNVECPRGTYFNSTLNLCALEPACQSSHSLSDIGTSCGINGEICIGLRDGLLREHTNDCNKYYFCFGGLACDMTCPPGLQFNKNWKKCDFPAHSGCDSEKTEAQHCGSVANVCYKEKDGVTFTNQRNSSKFVVCFNRCEKFLECPSGTHFDSSMNMCILSTCSGGDSCRPPSEMKCETLGGICAGLGNGLVKEVAKNCSQYALCFDGCVYKMSCPPGLNFNKKSKKCDWSDASACNSGSSQDLHCGPFDNSCNNQKDGVCFSKNSNSSNFVVCVGGCEKFMECPSGTHFNSNMNMCILSTCSGGDSCRPSSEMKCETLGGICAGLGNGLVKEVARNCSQYALCFDGCAYKMSCPPGLNFNEKSKKCDWSDASACNSGSSQDLHCGPVDNSCNNQKDGVCFSNNSNSSNFVVCVGGCEKFMECPSGTHFNSNMNMCMLSTCSGGDSCRPSSEMKCETLGGICAGLGNGLVKEVAKNCSQYALCFDGCAYKMSCPPGLNFNEKSKKCDWSDASACNSGSSQDLHCGPVDNSCNNQKDGVCFSNNSNSSNFVVCVGGCEKFMECPSGTHFNSNMNMCILSTCSGGDSCRPSSEMKCETLGGICAGLVNGLVKEVAKNCSQYALCFDGCAYKMSCPPGLNFNEKSKKCDWSDASACKSGSSQDLHCGPFDNSCNNQKDGVCFSKNSNSSNFVVCVGGCEKFMECPSGTHFNSNMNMCILSTCSGGDSCRPSSEMKCETLGGICAGQGNGLVKEVARNCSQYALCFDGCAYKMSCPPGLNFNEKSKKCDWSDASACNSGSSQDLHCGPVDNSCNNQKDGVCFSNNSNSSNFVVCVGGCEKFMECPSGTHFNSNMNMCMLSTCSGGDSCRPSSEMKCETLGGICAGLGNGLVKEVAKNCSQYALCFDGCAYKMSCPPGLNFNEKSKKCDWSDASACNSGSSQDLHCGPVDNSCNNQKDGVCFSNNSNSSNFVVCVGGCEKFMECPSGTHFNSNMNMCILSTCSGGDSCRPSSEMKCETLGGICAGLVNGLVKEVAKNCSQYALCFDGCAYKMSCPPGLNFNEKSKKCDWSDASACKSGSSQDLHCGPVDNSCNNQKDGVCFSNKSNSSNFVVCVGRCEKFMECPSGTYFNSNMNMCILSTCSGGDSCRPPSEMKCETLGGICAGLGNGLVKEVARNCSQYALCFDGCAYKMSCPPGLNFNEKSKKCDWSDASACNSGSSQDLHCGPVDNSCNNQKDGVCFSNNSNSSNFVVCVGRCEKFMECPSGTHFNSNMNMCILSTCSGGDSCRPSSELKCETLGGICAGLVNGLVKEVAKNCSQYALCFDGCAYKMSCPPGLNFNKKSKKCDWSDASGCNSESSQNLQCGPVNNACYKKKDGVTFSKSSSSTNFVVCVDGCEKRMDCPNGTYFDNSQQMCTLTSKPGDDSQRPPSEMKCELADGTCAGLSNGLVKEVAKTCSQYAFCFDGCAYKMSCPLGLHFNRKEKKCDFPEAAGCNSATSETPQCGQIGNSCFKQNNGVKFPDNRSCSSYIVCLNGCESIMKCPEGMHFNKRSKTCDLPRNAGCEAPIYPPATGPSGTVCESAGGSCKGLKNGTLREYKDRCDNYITCFNECGCDMKCPSGLHFNKKLQTCDFPYRAGCQK